MAWGQRVAACRNSVINTESPPHCTLQNLVQIIVPQACLPSNTKCATQFTDDQVGADQCQLMPSEEVDQVGQALQSVQ